MRLIDWNIEHMNSWWEVGSTDIARDLHYIALIWCKLDKHQKALRYCEQAFEIRLAKLGEEHSHTKETRNLLADIQVYANQGLVG